MTLEEAQDVAYIIGEADGGCGSCVDCLLDDLGKRFPEFDWKSSFDSCEYVAHEKEKYLKVTYSSPELAFPFDLNASKAA